jgi:DNA polymerase-3 subunit gamma/tau
MSREDVQLFYQTAILGRRDLALAPDPRTGFEMTLLRMLAFRPGDAAETRSHGGHAAPHPPRAAHASARAARRKRRAGDAKAALSWSAIFNQLDLSGAARQLASHCVLLGRAGGVVRLALDPARPFVSTPALEEKLAQALSRHFGEPCAWNSSRPQPDALSPARADEHASLAQLAAARESLESDPGVQALRERFGATLLPDSVRPIK